MSEEYFCHYNKDILNIFSLLVLGCACLHCRILNYTFQYLARQLAVFSEEFEIGCGTQEWFELGVWKSIAHSEVMKINSPKQYA